MMKCLSILVLVAVLGSTTTLSGQGIPPTLTLNGQVNASVAVGGSLDVTVVATPGALVYTAFNVNPGPTFVFGMAIPIGFDSSLLVIHDGLSIPMSGVFADSIPVRAIMALEGLTVFSVAATFDPTLPPFGFGFSNGATATFVRAPSAGPDTAGLTGSPITLDGSDTSAAGVLPVGTNPIWTIESGPAGHNAVLDGAGTLFPTLKADLSGVYTLGLSIQAPGTSGGNLDTVNVQAYELNVSSHAQGSFAPGATVNFAALLNGPAGATIDVPNVATGLNGSINGAVNAGTPLTQLSFEMQAQNGQRFGRGLTVINNAGSPPGQPSANSAGFHIRQPILDALESVIETALQQVDLSGPITGIPPLQVVNIPGIFGTTLFSATIQPTGFMYDPAVDLELTAAATGLNVGLTFNNVTFTFNMNGLLFNAPYSSMGTLTMSSINVSFDMVTTVNGTTYTTTAQNPQATVTGAMLTLTGGIPANLTTTFLNALLPVIQTTFAQGVAALFPPIFDQLLNALPQAIDLTGSNVPLVVDLLPGGLVYSSGGMTFALNAGAHAMPPSPAAAPVLGVYTTPNQVPAYNGMVPSSGNPYITAVAIGDDLLNGFLSASMSAGLLELNLGGDLTVAGQMIQGDASGFSLLFPGLGFEKFDALAPVRLLVHPTVAPIAQISNQTTSALTVTVSDLEVDVQVEAAPGYFASVLRVGLNGSSAVDVMYNAGSMALDLTPGMTTASAYVLGSMPGVDASTQIATLSSLLGSILPGLLGGVVSIPVPALDLSGLGIPGVMGSFVGFEVDGAAGDFLSLFFN